MKVNQDNFIKHYYFTYGLILIVFVFFLVNEFSLRYKDFISYHQSLSTTTTKNVADQVSDFIAEQKRLVDIFSKHHEKEITNIINNPDDEDAHAILAHKLKYIFPHYFTFSISNLTGEPIFEDFDGNFSDLCVNDLQSFAKTGIQMPRVHPNSNVYHFDIMTKFNFKQHTGILFISFEANLISRFIKASQSPNHKTMLVKIDDSTLIEIVDSGSRIKIARNDYRLSDIEKSHILSTTKVDNSLWHAIDMHRPNLFTSYYNNIIQQSIIIFSVIVLVVLLSLFLIIRQENLRKQSQKQKDEFLAMMSHDLRTPLTGIMGSLELVLLGHVGAITDKTKDFIKISLNSSKTLLALINNMLEYDKISSGLLSLNLKDKNLLIIVKQSIVDTTAYAQKFNSELKLIADENVNYDGKFDEQKLSQVLHNLISNACKYGKENDEIEIAVSKSSHSYVISITDHGNGIPEEFHDILFDKYTTTNTKAKKGSTSTGLGLTIAKSLVDLQNGLLTFKSKKDEGSTFTIKLPINDNNHNDN